MNGAVSWAIVSSVLVKVIVTVEVPPASILAGLKALPTDGAVAGDCTTVSVLTAGATLLPLVVFKAPAKIELM